MKEIEIVKSGNKFNLENACRTCGAFFDGEGVLIPIFSETGVIAVTNMEFQVKNELDLLNIIIEKDDSLPQQICIHCANTLKNIHIFRGVCKIAQEVLKDYFHGSSNEIPLKEKSNILEIEDEDPVMDLKNDEDENSIDSTYNTKNDEESMSSIYEIEEPIYSEIEIQLCDPSLDMEEETNINEDSHEGTNINEDSHEETNINEDSHEETNINQDSHEETNINGDSHESDNTDNKIRTQKECASIIRKCEKCQLCGYFDIAKYDVHKTRCISKPFDNKFVCLYCAKEFKTMNEIEDHLHEIHPIIERPYQCPVCDEFFKTMLKREEHVKTHNIKGAFKCDICNKGLGSYAHLKKHKQSLHTDTYECEICNKKFKHYIKLDYHTRLHYPDKRHKCQYCEKKYMHAAQLKEHERIHTGEKPYKCELCDKAFALNSSLSFHMKLHLGVKPFKCNVCGKGYPTRSALAHHTPFHGEDRPYQCEYCGRSFKTAHNLKTHYRSHSDERPFKCDLCEKTYRQNLQLKHHKYSAHGIGVPRKKQTYRCSKATIRRRVLKIRKRIAEEIEEIPCPLCSKTFRLHNSFENHMKTHNEDRRFVCGECGSAFKTSTILKYHIKRIHLKEKPFKCPHCEKTFTESKERNAHIKTHQDEKPFKCPYCDKSFKLKYILRNHIRTHTGEKPLKCLICQKSFSSSAHLTRHTLSHTAEEKKIATQRILENNLKNEQNKTFEECW